jgi:hypothetical protein
LEEPEEVLYSISGYAQKGPFIIGTNITVAELTEKLFPTGRVFFSTILTNEGYFELPGVVLESPYIQIKAEGLYYSERGGVEDKALTLYALADIRDQSTINVNLLTHLEKERVEFLVQQGNLTFADAKSKALTELLTVFEWQEYAIEKPEDLTIFNQTDGGSILLALSAIIEGVYEFETRLGLITSFQKDFEDGVLTDTLIQNRLVTSAFITQPEVIIENLSNRYPNREIADFSALLNHFVENSSYINYFSNIYPLQEDGSINLLEHQATTEINTNNTHQFAISIPAWNGLQKYLSVEVYGQFEQVPGNDFQGLAADWSSYEIYNCEPPPETICFSYREYSIYLDTKSEILFQSPVVFSGTNGKIRIVYQLTIDGFSLPYSIKDLTW